ncbi:YbjP/YqhG family protein [Mesorhizobium sp. AR02]|uniref:YbjP/YqhG family protein n=1 Tax=Mesorhizobium sp. AR02 TaxID=2865837 RepID=UPI00215F86ED|nr:YbjP/YqhG family protein [Mesorhizobium sp. AR02]UVK53466.1 YbjP/YqhG family protein [Mesorhizobium sp. AR02]
MRLTVLLAALSTALPAVAFAGPASDAVKFFYVPAVKFEADAQYRDRFTEPVTKLFDLNDQATKKNPDQVACIDFDPGLDAQDFDQKTVSKTLKLSETVDGDNAEVTASFSLFSEGDDSKREMVWSLKKIDGKWKISDIASKTSNWKLSALECVAGQE